MISDWRQQLADAAVMVATTNYAFDPDRVVLGYRRTPPEIDTLLTDGPFLAIRAGGRIAIDQILRQATYKIPVDLWIGIDRTAAESMITIEEFVENICANWEALGLVLPTFDEPKIQDKNNPCIVHYEFSVEITSPWCPS